MEWWEYDGYDAVDEKMSATTAAAKRGREIGRRQGLGAGLTIGSVGTATAIGAGVGVYKGGKALYKKFKNRNKGEQTAPNQPNPTPTQPAHIKGSANTQRGGYSEFEANGKVRECGTNCESWDWTDDPGAQMILESYFSEFADADIYSEAEY